MEAALEAGIYALVFGSALAQGGSEPWSRPWLWGGAAVLAILLVAALTLSRGHGGTERGAPNPILWPGLLFVAWALLSCLPFLPAAIRSLSPGASLVGAAWVAVAVVTSAAAAHAFRRAAARRRFAKSLVLFGAIIGFVALLQYATGATRIYGFLDGRPGNIPFGPFWNRNHYASWIVMVIPLALEAFTKAARPWTRPEERTWSLRRALQRLDQPAGQAFIWSTMPLLPLLGSLVATTSRAGILAFLASLAVAAALAGGRGRGVVRTAIAAFVVALLALAVLGPERLAGRVAQLQADSSARTSMWAASLVAARERPVAGSGLGTFPLVVSSWVVYPAAHNDYLQVLVETGVVGLGLALWAAAASLASVRRRPWLGAALAAPLLHAFVEFAFQTPAVGLTFVTLASLASASGRSANGAPA